LRGAGHYFNHDRFLLRDIQLCFLSVEGVSLLVDHFDLLPESVWQCAAEMFAYLLALSAELDSLMISDFWKIIAEFRGMFSGLMHFTADAMRPHTH
jgi:hypothetical protein